MDVKEKRDGRGEGRERKRKFFKGGREREKREGRRRGRYQWLVVWLIQCGCLWLESGWR
jgi:hypothetical protein